MVETANFGFQHVQVATSGREETINEGFLAIDALLPGVVVSDVLATPPASPAAGVCYIVAATATDEWSGWEGNIAAYINSTWRQIIPKEGWVFWVISNSGRSVYTGGGWVPDAGGMADAPSDGKIYGRQDGAWVEIVVSGGDLGAYTLTVSAANVASDLTDFPLKIDLRDMPPAFWTDVDEAGGNIRVYAADGTTVIPHDCVSCVVAEETGILYAKTNLLAATDTVLKVGLLATSVPALAVSDPNGRDAVWVDYEVAFIAPEKIDRTGTHTLTEAGNISPDRWKEVGRGADINMHQGVAWTATNWYAAGTNSLKKYDASWAVLSTNSDPVGDAITATGIGTLDHCGDPAVIGGELWVPIEKWNNGTAYGEAHLAVFNLSDLSFNRIVDISVGGRECSGCCEGPGGNIYVTDYVDGSSIPYYNASGVLQGTMVLSTAYAKIQGITYLNGQFYITVDPVSGDGKIYQVDLDGTVVGLIQSSYYGGSLEGITNDGTDLIYHKDQPAGFSGVRILRKTTGIEEWVKIHHGRLYATVPASTSFCMSTVAHPTLDLAQGSLVSLTSGSQRVTQLWDETPLRYASWDDSNSWTGTGPVTPAVYETRHIATGYNGTVERKVWAGGAVNIVDSGITQKITGATMTFIIGARDTAGLEQLYGHMGSALLRLEYPTDDWVAFEALNHKSPTASYAVT